MKSTNVIQGLRRLSRVLRGSGAQAAEEAFWDDYVRRVRKDGSHPYPCVGCDWHNEEEFLVLLQQYSSPRAEALEIGCGGGRITVTALRLFKHVHAADVSAEMLREARTAIAAPNVSFHKLDGWTLSGFSDASVDHVFSHDVFVQLSSIQVYPYLREIMRVLTPGGIALVSCYDFVGQFARFRDVSLAFWEARRPASNRRLHFVTEEMLRAMLDDIGGELLKAHRGKFLTIAFRKPR